MFKQIDFGEISRSIYDATLALAKGKLIIWFSALVSLSFGVINQIILKFYGGKELLGSYAAGWQIISIGILFLTQVARIGNPTTARITKPSIEKKGRAIFLIKYSTIMFLVVLPVCLATIVWPEFSLRQIYKPEYVSAANALRIMGIYLMAYSLGLVASQYVVSTRMEKIYFSSVVAGGIFGLILCLVLIPSMGDTGAGLALLISHGVAMGLYWVATILHVRKS